MKTARHIPLAAMLIAFAFGGGLRAQWVRESYPLVAGWNAIWISHDCSHAPITQLVGGQLRILEIWRWNPLGSSVQYVTTPSNPVSPDAEWGVWRSGDTTGSTLSLLTGNSAYLVKVSDGPPLTLQLTGRPLVPTYNGRSSGLSFGGFPMLPGASASQRRFDRFLSFDSILRNKPQIFRYVGGALSDTAPRNPVEITQPVQTSVERNQAYWVEPRGYTSYYGPLEVTVVGGDGLDYGTAAITRTIRIRNVTDPSKNQTVTANLALAASADPPAGQPAIAGAVPLLLDNGIDEATLTRNFEPFTGEIQRTIPPGGEVDVDFILDRGAMGTVADRKFQSVLQVTDSLNLTRVDLPVSAISTSLAGLWVGDVVLDRVDQIPGSGPSTGSDPVPTSAPFTMRLLVHVDASGQAVLLQQAYAVPDVALLGQSDTTFKIYTHASYRTVSASSQSAMRLSSAAFPLDLVADGSGTMAPGGTLSFQVRLLYDAPTNPFVHAYHPAHDNRSADFRDTLGRNVESYEVTRAISLAFHAGEPGNPAWGSKELTGAYSESIDGLRTSAIRVSGVFRLQRVARTSAFIK